MSPQALRYPACPTCSRPLYPHARGGVCCLACVQFVDVSVESNEAARAAARFDGLADLTINAAGSPGVAPPRGLPCPTCRSRRGLVTGYLGPKCVCGAPLSHPSTLRRGPR